ncbi:hypothetical protein [uncultured Nostoc sp.]|uniref:hypothetical protein n=1 Tax=uncultured Nostoc sp. TaxID=340711 RepID=UPI0035CA34D5
MVIVNGEDISKDIQKSIAQKIITTNADYVLSLKDNHPTLHQQVKNKLQIKQ